MNGKVCLIDMDIVAVSTSAACEKRSYLFDGKKYQTKKELYESTARGLERSVIDAEVEVLVEAQPLSHARQCARQLVQSILDKIAPIREYRGYITGKGNFRYEVATIQPYKGNRDKSAQPLWRREVEEFLLSEFNTERVCGIEADDKLAVEFLKDPANSVLCSLDKDFRQIPNLTMYSWRKKEFEFVSPTDALRNFYTQVLTGDQTDSIPGVPGIGEKGAEKLLGKLKDEKLMLTVCYSQYQRAYGKGAWAALVENCKLLYLCRTEAELADPKNAFKPCLIPQGVSTETLPGATA